MASNTYKIGNIVKGQVTGIEDYGIFVSLDNYYSGLIHISEISDQFVKNIHDYVNIGETIKVKITDIEENTCHLKLSIKDIDYRINKKQRVFIKEVGSGFGCLAEKLDDWIEKKYQEIEEAKSKQ